ncbi:5-formyltetrahydrofolate cyclo-ligase [Candidatus Peregrinibacteria bacterium]|nr:5-formyltetrahydrofolate cyclo-ligase [Candidatus Peregrinibacteria bacterium]
MDKDEIRSSALKKRKALSSEKQEEKSEKIISRLEALDVFKQAEVVLIYYSHHGEVRTQELMARWIGRKQFLLPRLTEGDTFLVQPVSSLETLEENRFGIPEPAVSEVEAPRPDLIVVPGVAFDRDGNRIGMGSGYYDRFLEDKKDVPKVALAYSEQVLDEVPKEPYDEPVDYIITEDEVIRC